MSRRYRYRRARVLTFFDQLSFRGVMTCARGVYRWLALVVRSDGFVLWVGVPKAWDCCEREEDLYRAAARPPVVHLLDCRRYPLLTLRGVGAARRRGSEHCV